MTLPRSSWALVVVIVVVGCSSPAAVPTPVQPVATPPADAGASDAAPVAGMPPPLARVKRISIVRQQGGPMLPRCHRVLWRATLDLPAWRYTSASCDAAAGQSDPLIEDGDGTLPPAVQTKLAAIYNSMRPKLDGCSHDGGMIHLDLELDDGSRVSVVDENWGCSSPAPKMLTYVDDLATTLWLAIRDQ